MREFSKRLLEVVAVLLRSAPSAKAVEALTILSDEPSPQTTEDDAAKSPVAHAKRKRAATTRKPRAAVPRKPRRAKRAPDSLNRDPPRSGDIGNGDGRRLSVEQRDKLTFLLEANPREVRASAGVSAEVAAEAAAGAELSEEVVSRLATYLAG
jgi:hypothetical protein